MAANTENQQLAAAACAVVRTRGTMAQEFFTVVDLLATALQGDGDPQAETLKILVRRDRLLSKGIGESTCNTIVEIVARAEIMVESRTGSGFTNQQLPRTLDLFRRIAGTGAAQPSKGGVSGKFLVGAAMLGGVLAFVKDR